MVLLQKADINPSVPPPVRRMEKRRSRRESMSDTPKTDAAERFMYDSRKERVGFIPAELGRSLERELSVARHALATGTAYVGSEAFAGAAAQNGSDAGTGVEGSSQSGHDGGLTRAHAAVPAAEGMDRATAPVGTATAAGERKRRAAPDGAGDFVEYSKGDVLFNKGDAANYMAVIIEGSVEIFDPEHNHSIAVSGKGSFFGEQAILQGGVRAASVRAHENVTCMEIKTENLRGLLHEDGGIMMPAVEALLLQLCMANSVAGLFKTADAERRFEVISENRMSGSEIRKLLSEAYANEQGHGFSSDQMLYLKLNASNKLYTVPFSEGQKLGVSGDEHPGAAYVIVKGEVDAVQDAVTVRLGLGSVIGLAEGLTNSPLQMTYTAAGHVTTLILPMDQVIRAFSRSNAGIKAIVRYTAARIVELERALLMDERGDATSAVPPAE